MPRVSKKYPPELLKILINVLVVHPGSTKEELAPVVRPFHESWFNPKKAKESDFGRYFNGAMKKAGSKGAHREIRFFKKKDTNGKMVNAHALTSANDIVEILEAQISTIEQQIGGLKVEKEVLEYRLEKFREEGKTISMVIEGEIVERTGSGKK